jgi:preprotein translocase subunit SecE
MAVDVARPQSEGKPPLGRRLVDFYHGVIAEMRKVTWPDRQQVRQATIAITIFVLLIGLVITILDTILSGILVRMIPSLLLGR